MDRKLDLMLGHSAAYNLFVLGLFRLLSNNVFSYFRFRNPCLCASMPNFAVANLKKINLF